MKTVWHTLLLDPSSYVEASCTAGFAFGTLKAVRKRYVDNKYKNMGFRAIEAVIETLMKKVNCKMFPLERQWGKQRTFINRFQSQACRTDNLWPSSRW
jgi:unsaturated rhamnogalacturonyl hydrolase